MKVLLSWLRELVAVESSAAELAQALSLAGQAVDAVVEEQGETLLDLDLTSNRPDCLSHFGLAREIAAITGQPLRPPPRAGLARHPAGARVQIEAPEACGRYGALLLEAVQIGATAELVAARLERLGQRAINNIADATNYTLWEMGHPTHAFDADRLRGGHVVVRWARAGEMLVTLDEVKRTLTAEDLVIADAEGPVALAGVLGGKETAIGPQTRRVLLESAWFDPQAVRQTARRHGLHTEASHRFERGADPEAVWTAAERITALLHGHARPAVGGIIYSDGNLPPRKPIALRPERIASVLGAPIPAAECQRKLTALGCEAHGDGAWVAPSWRPDLSREIDLIEELARLHGYDRFPSRLPAFHGRALPLPEEGLRQRVRQQLRGRGFAEAISLSFAAESECRAFAPQRTPVRVSNPLSEEAAILRTSSLPAMLHLLQYNAHRELEARLFEMGKLYERDAAGEPRERAVLALGACDGPRDFRAWRGEVEAVLGLFDRPPLEATAAGGLLDPGARIGEWAWLGRLHPELAAQWKLPDETWLAEIDLERALSAGARPVAYARPPRFPASVRDFSFLLEEGVSWAQIEHRVNTPPISDLMELQPVEVFRGANLAEGRYSLLIRAKFQSRERTLRDEEVQASADEIVRRLKELGGIQR
ncbi:MAG: phenylalanine--tRNA ligase subunit beta [Terriglobales bacterium]